jgi:L-malate glycosyltransferase
MGVTQKIAIICNYELLPDRIGGMDYFFWLFEEKCKQNNIATQWFFINSNTHGAYANFNVVSCDYQNVEHFFAAHYLNQPNEYSHIITHFVELCSPIFKEIKRKSEAKIIMVDHNPRPINGYSLKKRIEKKMKGILYSRYIDTFVGVSEYSKNQIISEFGAQLQKKSTVVFNGLNHSKFIQKTQYNFQGRFIVAAHLRKDKGIQDLIETVYELNSKQPVSFTIDVYGIGVYEEVLKQKVADYNLQSIIIFKGNVTNLYELYHEYDYLIHPSHGETFCYSVVESLMSRLPVITTKNQGNVLGLVRDGINGFLFEEENINQLQTILYDISVNGKQAVDFSQTNTEILNYSLDNMVENYLKLVR